MVITLDYQREQERPILGALRGLHKGIKRMDSMIQTHAGEFLLGYPKPL
jgi:hypothetical protein